jgi:ribosomal protein L32E
MIMYQQVIPTFSNIRFIACPCLNSRDRNTVRQHANGHAVGSEAGARKRDEMVQMSRERGIVLSQQNARK